MKIQIKNDNVTSYSCDLLCVSLLEDVIAPSGATGDIDAALGGIISDLIKEKEISGGLGKATVLHTYGKIPAKRVAILGLGKPEKFTVDDLREVGSVISSLAKEVNAKEIATIIHGVEIKNIYPKEAATVLLDGIMLGGYKFSGLKSKKENGDDYNITTLTFIDNKEEKLKGLFTELSYVQSVNESVNRTRDLVNLSANIASPSYVADKAKQIVKKYRSIKLKVFDKKDLEKLKAGAFLSVAAGAHRDPKLLVLEYISDKTKETVGLIGKGITFDSGGISLKPPKKMVDMKTDMAGAATVLAVVETIAKLKISTNVLAVIPLTENMPGGGASRPGDIVTTLSGKTVEIISTDAEGRMIMADALTYAKQNGATKLIDIATLTGGAVIALGEVNTAIMGNDQLWVDQIQLAGKKVRDKIWQLPLDKEYEESLESDVADMVNCTEDGKASPIIGGTFLKEFAKDLPWDHLDIAGTAYTSRKISGIPKGATGACVKTLVELFKQMNFNK